MTKKTTEEELAAKVRYIQITSSKIVKELLAGEYRSVFKGSGMDFDEVRRYVPGDDVRSIDWNVTARTTQTYVKRFVEERELNLFFLVDLSPSGIFGSTCRSKNEAAAEICALLAFSAVLNNDRIGLIIFTDRVELFVPPSKGRRHVLTIINDLLAFEPRGGGTDIAGALSYFGGLNLRSCVLFLMSDFQNEGFEDPLRTLSIRHDVIAVSMFDRHEMVLPCAGLIELRDRETGRSMVVDTDDPAVRQKFQDSVTSRCEALDKTFDEMQVDQIRVHTDEDYVENLIRFFRIRERRLVGESLP